MTVPCTCADENGDCVPCATPCECAELGRCLDDCVCWGTTKRQPFTANLACECRAMDWARKDDEMRDRRDDQAYQAWKDGER